MTRRLLSYAFPFMDSFDPLAQAPGDRRNRRNAANGRRDVPRLLHSHVWNALGVCGARDRRRLRCRRPAAGSVLPAASTTPTVFESDDHRRNYLFRVATNLIRDRYRRPRIDNAQLAENGEGDIPAGGDLAQQTQQRTDLRRAMAQLSRRERQLVWLAYGQGSTHQEIAGALGLKTGSIKPLLFRARRKLARILDRQGS